jgi:hypothetical protein
MNITLLWYTHLCTFSCINIFIYFNFFNHNIFAGIYTCVCAFRSFFPRVDAERVVLFDTCLSSIFLGRLLATFAEISFAIVVSQYNYILITNIILAQMFCWTSVITQNPFYHIIEESLWAVSSLYFIFYKQNFFAFLYLLYMIKIDIPMYVQKYRSHKEKSLSVIEGLYDSIFTRYENTDWNFWRKEAFWMTPYFTFGVWAVFLSC